jgi:hypothetical protein
VNRLNVTHLDSLHIALSHGHCHTASVGLAENLNRAKTLNAETVCDCWRTKNV